MSDETARLREQLHACIAASKDMHAAQAETIDELRAKLADAERERDEARALRYSPPTHTIHIERDAAIARAEAAERERDALKNVEARVLADRNYLIGENIRLNAAASQRDASTVADR